MRKKRNPSPVFDADRQKISHLYYDEGKTGREIAEIIGRSTSSIYHIIYNMRHNPAPSPEKHEAVGIIANGNQSLRPVLKMTPREMIKALYDMGYRIENNKLVCYQKVEVKLQDIINDKTI